MGSNVLFVDRKSKDPHSVRFTYTSSDIRKSAEYCFLQIVHTSAARSGFYNVWASSLENRSLFYVRAIRQMHNLVHGSQDVSICTADDALHEHFDNWRWHLCNFAHLPQHLVVKSLASVLAEYLDGKLYDSREWQFTALIPVRNMYSPIKPRHRVGTMIQEPDPGAFEDVERQLEDVLASAYDRALAPDAKAGNAVAAMRLTAIESYTSPVA